MAMPDKAALTISTSRKPKRRNTVDAMVRMNMPPKAEAHVISPDSNALLPSPSCSSSGNRNGNAPKPIRNSDPPATLA